MVTMMLGGRAAEEIVIKDISTGASNDIERASNIANALAANIAASLRRFSRSAPLNPLVILARILNDTSGARGL